MRGRPGSSSGAPGRAAPGVGSAPFPMCWFGGSRGRNRLREVSCAGTGCGRCSVLVPAAGGELCRYQLRDVIGAGTGTGCERCSVRAVGGARCSVPAAGGTRCRYRLQEVLGAQYRLQEVPGAGTGRRRCSVPVPAVGGARCPVPVPAAHGRVPLADARCRSHPRALPARPTGPKAAGRERFGIGTSLPVPHPLLTPKKG